MTLKKRILICGGRKCFDREFVCKVLDEIEHFFDPAFIVIEGECLGVDIMGKRWAQAKGRPTIGMEAGWDFYKKAAGSIRNKWMLDYGLPDLVVAIRGGKGTADMVKQAKARGIDTYERS